VIITRRNDRRLRITATDWVKNGDQWTVLHVAQDGALKVRHTQNGRTALPPRYVGTASELGYATTVHGAHGVTVATMHGLATGHESRQQLYTMLTRGRTASSWNSTSPTTELPSLIGGSMTPASTTSWRRSPGCRAFPTGSPTILTGDLT
jgi:hypothetical protein